MLIPFPLKQLDSSNWRKLQRIVGSPVVSVLFLLGAAIGSANGANTPAGKFSADSPSLPQALSQADFTAIVAEADLAASQPRGDSLVTPLPARWQTLDAARLLAIMSMPSFGQIPIPARGVLLDQAATWDLLTFQRPSDAARLWERLWPRRSNDDPHAGPNSTGIGYAPDPTWAPTANAMLTLFSCFPRSVWVEGVDPLVFAERHPISWQWQNHADWDGFKKCVPQGAFFSGTEPNQARLDALTKNLSETFTAELSTDGCGRSGPDDCMLLFQALSSLDPSNPRLPKLLGIIERSVHLDQRIRMPALAASSNRDGPSAAELETIEIPEAEALRRIIFLTMKLPLLLQHPTAWPVGELERVLSQATELTVLLARIQTVKTFRHPRFARYYSNPWQWVDAGVDTATRKNQRDLGSTYAGREACALTGLEINGGTPSFWQGYVIENIRLGHGDCGRFNALQLARIYRVAITTANTSEREHELDVLSTIKTVLSQSGPLHEAALDDLVSVCAEPAITEGNDIWHLCADVRARDAALAEAERVRIAEEHAAMAPVDPLACDEGVIARAASALNFTADGDFWNAEKSACRVDPEHAGYAIVALSYVSGEENGGEVAQSDDANYDLDVIILNLEDDSVVAHRHDAALIPSDAIRFEGLSIDTARYQLAPDKRAFGIRTSHSAHCYACSYSYTDMTLYLVNGKAIDSIMDIRTDETRNEETASCPDAIAQTTASLMVGEGSSHGLADLIVNSSTSFESNSADSQDDAVVDSAADAASIHCPSPESQSITMSFDGLKYILPASAKSRVPSN